ncbi:hypothetical protein Tco_1375324 [Tanacetum coccineum]
MSFLNSIYSLGNIIDRVDIEDLTIEQYLELTQENPAPSVRIKVDDMTIVEYLEYEETIKTQEYDDYQPHSVKADVPTRYRDHLSPHYKSPDPPLDAKTNPYFHASQFPIYPKITKTPSKHTRENKVIKKLEQSNQGLGDWFDVELKKCWKILQKRDNIHLNLRRKAQDDALINWEAQINQLRRQEHEVRGIPDKKLKHYWKSTNGDDRIGVEWEGLSCTNWVRVRYGKEDPEKCGESKTRAIIRAMINYLEPTFYDGFIYHNEEAYKRRRNKLLGMPYIEPPPIIKEEAEITKYNMGASEVFMKTKILNIKGFPRTASNIADIRAEIINDRNSSSEDLSNTKRRHWCKPIYQWKEDICTKWASCNPHFDECDGEGNPIENKEYWESSNDNMRTNLEWENLSFKNWVKVTFGRKPEARRQASRPARLIIMCELGDKELARRQK